jgi:hypothetical protein
MNLSKFNLAVYNNPSVKIQSKINKILSIDYAKEQAGKVEKINSLEKRTNTLTKEKQRVFLVMKLNLSMNK